MRLLNRNEVQNQKSTERSVEIQEGLKLAKKIDVLRETASKEESTLAKFRAESLKAIREEIDTLSAQKKTLTLEILELQGEKKRLQLALKSIESL